MPCGQCLGGGGSINCAFHVSFPLCTTFGHLMCASDYGDWETVYQNPGWGSKDLIPLLRKVRKGEGQCTTGSEIEES